MDKGAGEVREGSSQPPTLFKGTSEEGEEFELSCKYLTQEDCYLCG